MEYPTSNTTVTKGKSVEAEKYIVEHYNYLNFQDRKERENKEDKLRRLQPTQLISALDKKNQSMKIATIQPSLVGDPSKERVIEFKLNMSHFSVLDRVDFFKQTSELIFSDLINVSVSKEKIQRDF